MSTYFAPSELIINDDGSCFHLHHMAKFGYDVTVFEALHEIGGVLKYGIPEFRLPNKIVDVEIENLQKMGVKFVKDCIVGKTIKVSELEAEGYKGIFVGSGAGLPNFMNIEGENLINIMSSNEYLTRVNLMDAASKEYYRNAVGCGVHPGLCLFLTVYMYQSVAVQKEIVMTVMTQKIHHIRKQFTVFVPCLLP